MLIIIINHKYILEEHCERNEWPSQNQNCRPILQSQQMATHFLLTIYKNPKPFNPNRKGIGPPQTSAIVQILLGSRVGCREKNGWSGTSILLDFFFFQILLLHISRAFHGGSDWIIAWSWGTISVIYPKRKGD